MIESKICTRCRNEVPLTDFPSSGRGGKRARCKICEAFVRRQAGRETRARKKWTADGVRAFLPIAPFREWCVQRMADDGIGPGTFCARIGIPERRLTDYLSGEAKHVTVYVVDRALCRDGGWHLSQLYPDLYPDASPDLVGLLQAVGDIAAREAWELDHIDERTAA